MDHDSDDLLGSVEDVTEFAFYAYDDLADAVDLQRHAANDVEYMVFLVDAEHAWVARRSSRALALFIIPI